jgi:protein involved in polysaccharide export with SLBB domain
MRVFVSAVAAAVLVVAVGARGAEKAAAGAGGEPAARATVEESLGTIENRDLLRVAIGEPSGAALQSEKRVRVDEDGTVRLPYVGAQKVAGLTTAAAEAALAKAYRDAQISPQMLVDVRRVEVGSRVPAAPGPIAAGDLVAVTVNDLLGPASETELPVRVGADGRVSLPAVGLLKIGGLTEGQAEEAVAKEYNAKQVIRHPVVAVRVAEPAARAKVKAGPLAKGDLLSVMVADLTAPGVMTPARLRVGQDGQVALPLAGLLKVEGLTEAEAAEAVVEKYKDARLIQLPMVALVRLEGADQADVKLGPIAKGEVLRVGVSEVAGPGQVLTKTVRVDDEGRVQMPLVGPVKVEGLSENDATAAVAKRYREMNLIQSAMVTVLKVNGAAPVTEEDLRRPRPPEPATPEPVKARARRR